ncbi:hypothetical protein HDU83_004821 [Entophlyctis luteolus]|nr:hypothetical protein HDU83_004821 [Entophlyctis luteolus]
MPLGGSSQSDASPVKPSRQENIPNTVPSAPMSAEALAALGPAGGTASATSIGSVTGIPSLRANPIPVPRFVTLKKSFGSVSFPPPTPLLHQTGRNSGQKFSQTQQQHEHISGSSSSPVDESVISKDIELLEKIERVKRAIKPEIEAYASVKDIVESRDIPELRENASTGRSVLLDDNEDGSFESDSNSGDESSDSDSNTETSVSISESESFSESYSESDSDSSHKRSFKFHASEKIKTTTSESKKSQKQTLDIIIDSEDFLDEISAVRGAYKRAFKELVIQAMQAIQDEHMSRKLLKSPPSNSSDFSTDESGDSQNNAIILRRSSKSSRGMSDKVPFYSKNVNVSTQSLFSTESVYGARDFSEMLDLHPSRYREDFEEMRPLGKGGFGQVWCVRNKLDGVEYAVKRVKLKEHGRSLEKILREVKAQARMTHQNVVRYFSCWLEHASPSNNFISVFEDSCETAESSEDFSSEIHSPNSFSDNESLMRVRNLFNSRIAGTNSNDELKVNIAGMNDEIEGDSKVPEEESDFDDYEPNGRDSHKNGGDAFLSKSYASVETVSLHTANSDGLPGKFTNSSRQGKADSKSNSRKTPSRISHPRELTLFIQMEVCGNTLQQYLSFRNKAIFSPNFGEIPESELLDAIAPEFCSSILRDICSGLAYIHSQDCIHRDIKPQNIYYVPRSVQSTASLVSSSESIHSSSPVSSLAHSFKSSECREEFLSHLFSRFRDGGFWKIGDFGLVTLSSDERPIPQPSYSTSATSPSSIPPLKKRTTRIGTVTYASPEQLETSEHPIYTPKSDMYSVGIVFFELLHPVGTGMERAKVLSSLRHVEFPEDFLRRWPKEATHILGLLSKDPEYRPSAHMTLEFLNLLQIDKSFGETESDVANESRKQAFSVTERKIRTEKDVQAKPLGLNQYNSTGESHQLLVQDFLDPVAALDMVRRAEERARIAEEKCDVLQKEVSRLRERLAELQNGDHE